MDKNEKTMRSILLVSPPYLYIYKKSGLKMGAPSYPPLNLSILASIARKMGFDVEILDLNIFRKEPQKILEKYIDGLNPEIIGFTVTTPMYYQFKKLVSFVRDTYGKSIKIIAGGHHISALPYEVSRDAGVDHLFIGESEITFKLFLKGKIKQRIVHGIPMKNLNKVPLPSWDILVGKKLYKRNYTKRNPVTIVQTTRGCPYRCIYCSKVVSGYNFRAMNPRRSLKEYLWANECGFEEIHIADDVFTHDLKRAKEICKMLIREKIDIPWTLMSGVRVNEIDEEFLRLAYRAGCYSISFGVESGSQRILNRIKKGTKIEQIKKAFELSKKIGFETMASFMVGLPGERLEDFKKTIEFAISLDPDWVKLTIATPLPGTEFFQELESKGLIKSKDWSKFFFHTYNYERPFLHEYFSDNQLDILYKLAYKKFLFRPRFVIKRLRRLQWFTDIVGALNFLITFSF